MPPPNPLPATGAGRLARAKGSLLLGQVVEHLGATLDMETLRAMITDCRKRGLTFTIRGGSWHFPGSTVLVEFKRA